MASSRCVDISLSDDIVSREMRYLAESVVDTGLAKTSPNLRGCLVDLVCQSLKHTQERCTELLKHHVNEDSTEDSIKELHGFMEETLTAVFRQTNSHLHENQPKDHHEDHVNVIRELSTVIEREICLEGTLLLDRLIEEDILSEAGRESILALPTSHAKCSAFTNFMCGNFTKETFVNQFLPILKEEQLHEHLACELEKNVKQNHSGTERKAKCSYCKMKSSVNLRRLCDALYQMGAISESLRRDLSSSTLSTSAKWEELLKEVQSERVIKDALERKYPHLYRDFMATGHSLVTCCCPPDNDIQLLVPNVSDVARISDVSSLEEELSKKKRKEFHANLEELHRQYFSDCGGWVYTGILEDDTKPRPKTGPNRFPWTRHRRGGLTEGKITRQKKVNRLFRFSGLTKRS